MTGAEPEDFGVGVRPWTDLIRRARLGSSAKAVAMMLANYADSNGRRVFPGLPRIAVECELNYKTVQAAMEKLRRAGLIERVRKSGKRGQADEYRLTIGPSLLDHVNVLSPTELRLAMEAVRRPRGKGRRPSEGADVAGERQPSERGDVEEGQPSEWADVDSESEDTSAQWAGRPDPTSAQNRATRQPNQWAPTLHRDRVTTTTLHSGKDLRTDVAVPGRSAAVVEEDPLPRRCGHGLPARRLPDGSSSCALCRRESELVAKHGANVIPFRRDA